MVRKLPTIPDMADSKLPSLAWIIENLCADGKKNEKNTVLVTFEGKKMELHGAPRDRACK